MEHNIHAIDCCDIRCFDLPSWRTFILPDVLEITLQSVSGPVPVFHYFYFERRLTRLQQAIAAITILLQPSLILIDNGHFQ